MCFIACNAASSGFAIMRLTSFAAYRIPMRSSARYEALMHALRKARISFAPSGLFGPTSGFFTPGVERCFEELFKSNCSAKMSTWRGSASTSMAVRSPSSPQTQRKILFKQVTSSTSPCDGDGPSTPSSFAFMCPWSSFKNSCRSAR